MEREELVDFFEANFRELIEALNKKMSEISVVEEEPSCD